MPVFISTDGTAPAERVALWRDKLNELFQADYAVDADADEPLSVAMTLLRLGSLTVAESAGTAMRASRAADPERAVVVVCLPFEGSCRVRQDGREMHLVPGNLGLYRTGEASEMVFDGRFRLVMLWMRERRLCEAFPGWERLAGRPVPVACGPGAVLADLLGSVLRHAPTLAPGDRAVAGNALVGLCASALAAVVQGEVPEFSRMERYHLERVKSFARANLGEADLDVTKIAAGVGLSVSYVHKLFAREPLRLMQWIAAERLDACHRELASSSAPRRPIYQIAGSWGFDDQAHFSRAFRARFGITPKQARDGQPPCLGQQMDCPCAGESGPNSGAAGAKNCFRSRC